MTTERGAHDHRPVHEVDVPAAGPRGDTARGVDRQQAAGTGPAVRSAFTDGVVWTAIGAAVGAVIALPLALVVLSDVDALARVLIVAAVGAVGGSVVGFALAAGRSDDDADNGLGALDAQAEEDAGFQDHLGQAHRVDMPWRPPAPD